MRHHFPLQFLVQSVVTYHDGRLNIFRASFKSLYRPLLAHTYDTMSYLSLSLWISDSFYSPCTRCRRGGECVVALDQMIPEPEQEEIAVGVIVVVLIFLIMMMIMIMQQQQQ